MIEVQKKALLVPDQSKYVYPEILKLKNSIKPERLCPP
jgi:hypothetical protein